MKNTTWEFYFFLMVSNNACNCCTSEAGFKYQVESLYSKKENVIWIEMGYLLTAAKNNFFFFFQIRETTWKASEGVQTPTSPTLIFCFADSYKTQSECQEKAQHQDLGVYRTLPRALLPVFAKGSVLACICTSALAASWEDCLQKLVLQSSQTSFICTFKENSGLTGSSEKWRGTSH